MQKTWIKEQSLLVVDLASRCTSKWSGPGRCTLVSVTNSWVFSRHFEHRCRPSRPFFQDLSGRFILLRIVMQDAMGQVLKVFPQLNLKVYVDVKKKTTGGKEQ